MTTKIITYYSFNANPKEAWLAYAVLPNGQPWLVRCAGETEEIAVAKAVRLYESEQSKYKKTIADAGLDNEQWTAEEVAKMKEAKYLTGKEIANVQANQINPWSGLGRGSHFVGKSWLINTITREKIRVPSEEVERYLADGWEKGGPRSK